MRECCGVVRVARGGGWALVRSTGSARCRWGPAYLATCRGGAQGDGGQVARNAQAAATAWKKVHTSLCRPRLHTCNVSPAAPGLLYPLSHRRPPPPPPKSQVTTGLSWMLIARSCWRGVATTRTLPRRSRMRRSVSGADPGGGAQRRVGGWWGEAGRRRRHRCSGVV